jgi:hypothetical protein
MQGTGYWEFKPLAYRPVICGFAEILRIGGGLMPCNAASICRRVSAPFVAREDAGRQARLSRAECVDAEFRSEPQAARSIMPVGPSSRSRSTTLS